MMSVITISRGSFSHGREVAEKVADKLGYQCISRDVLLDVSKEFNISEIKLTRAIRNAPSFLERYTFGRERYIAFIRAAILEHLAKDNTVYHGFAGQFFVKEIPHVIKVRILADMEERIACMMNRERLSSREEALNIVNEVDRERKEWSLKLYGIDTWDSRLYDLVIKIDRITVDDAVEFICSAAKLKRFQTTPESQKMMDELVRESRENLRDARESPFFEPMRDSPWRK